VTLVFAIDEVKVKTKNHFSPLSPTLWKSSDFEEDFTRATGLCKCSINRAFRAFLEKWGQVEGKWRKEEKSRKM
jgi:hypothetical protein